MLVVLTPSFAAHADDIVVVENYQTATRTSDNTAESICPEQLGRYDAYCAQVVCHDDTQCMNQHCCVVDNPDGESYAEEVGSVDVFFDSGNQFTAAKQLAYFTGIARKAFVVVEAGGSNKPLGTFGLEHEGAFDGKGHRADGAVIRGQFKQLFGSLKKAKIKVRLYLAY